MKMSFAIAAFSAALLAALPASAESWQEFNYPEMGFAISFPGQPVISKGSYRTLSGTELPATIYTVEADKIRYSMTVVDFGNDARDQAGAIADAVKLAAARGTITLDVEERIDRNYGHTLTLTGKDGSLSSISIFFFGNRLYQLEGRALPPDAQSASNLLMRFQQGLQFSGTPGLPPRGGPGLAGRGGALAGLNRRPPPQAFADCAGRNAGDAVQHTIPSGLTVASTCIATPQGLAARPNMPPL